MSGPFYNVVPQYDELAFGSITASTAGTAHTLQTLTRDRRTIVIVSNLNAEVGITMDGVQKGHVPANGTVSFDLGSNSQSWSSGTVIGVFHRGTAPTTAGRIGITAL